MIEVDVELDLKGMSCPMPLLKAKQALSKMNQGEVLRVQATDPGSVRDFACFARISGHKLLASDDTAGVFVFTLEHK
ncbi:sulfurtransferase TusA family protein [Endozoicomonas numazuensis]|uniref:Response regulator SirA n=1 Tax=Endozoicomonas numazuensis TaxID=1137799 RepID=A0A081NE08_9GAMM|nr:sulfurtransferase TusA family protein [Endozoicomonas numazuensis]KEQ16681.1 response regulator SirA [Endozoicomonas numazuensis]